MTPSQARQVAWICHQCALDHGAEWPREDRCATFHIGTCGVCQEERTVTEPRDYDWRGIRR